MLKVHVLGLTFYGVDDSIRHGFEGYSIDRGGLTGWWGRPASARGGGGARPGAHGEFDEPLYLPARFPALAGQVRQRSARDRAIACEQLSGIGADGARTPVVVEEDGVSTWAWCRVIGVDVERYTSGHHPEYEVQLKCANPRRFGEVRQSPPTASLQSRTFENRGNFRADPRFFVRGPQPTGYRIWGEGNADPFEVATPLAAGVTDVVDFATGTVVRGGSLLVGGVVAPRVWSVPAASSRRWEAALSGSGTIAGEITDTSV